ncbi:phospholipid/cholesterol/gamma-HCH transport system substrate-binding protein [Sulfurivirga caldicuralii]|uniref:Phospholipid/cholesterol/gamma-HCH transport system substrate-binding protein n=1 Tax=Sulfurivirga caldicuralii TaxID=364032 RepID=A0A1N6G3I4_9GAMM|nr:outer membrane lipid asymmetry maintenance protein MlaD [Sulfurivirga caldicuralii]SIO02060.1 phospholipid/cholesterol/gamma-HCH transport system substrate-binding protein [Sulfurivirga caldicuralii]
MGKQAKIEIGVGILVLFSIISLFVIAMKVSNFADMAQDRPTYTLKAHFDNIGGLKVRAPVKLSGVVIGRVASIGVDKSNYRALVTMKIDKAYQLPLDTSASILTSGLLGDQYIGLEPGGDDQYLADEDEIEMTQSALVLENLIGQLMVKLTDSGDKQ